jgi:hypothetical protein
MTLRFAALEKLVQDLKAAGIAPDAKVWVYMNFMHFDLVDVVDLRNKAAGGRDVSIVGGVLPRDEPMGGVKEEFDAS